MHKVLERFYLSSLSYAGLKVESNTILNKSDKLGDITIDGKQLGLPYNYALKDPDDKIFFHLLNESYTNPETTTFDFYRKRLTLELNLKLSYVIVNLIAVAADVQLQQKVKSSKLINIISNIGEVDHTLTENFTNLIKASRKENAESFLFDIYLKKNGEINDTPYAAIGKINFIAHTEVNKAIEEKDREFRVFGYKLRKKDLLALNNIFNIIFPDITDKTKYTEGTDNKIFRYLNILLKTSYMVSDRLNDICDLLEELKEPTLNIEDCRSDHEWVECLEDLYGLSTEIRLIPDQTNLRAESNHRLHIDETKASINIPQQPQVQVPMQSQQVFNPVQVQQLQPTYQQPQPQQPQSLSAEDIVRGNLQPQMPMQPMMMPQQMMQPIYGMQPPMSAPTPSWIQQENMRSQMPQQQMQMQQGMMPMQMQPSMMPMQQIPMMPQQQMYMQPGMTQQMPMQQSSGLTPNPLFSAR